MLGLTSKEYTAIQSRYLGLSYKDIARQVDIPKQTIEEWFKTRGKLSAQYEEFSNNMNEQRQAYSAQTMGEMDNETLLTIKLLMSKLQETIIMGQKKVLMHKGEPVLDERGNVRYYYEPYKVKTSDFFKVWKIQRVMKNLPCSIVETRCPVCNDRTHTLT